MGNSHENSKDNEGTLGTYDILEKEEKGATGSLISKGRMGDSQVVEEELNTHGRLIVRRQPTNNGTRGNLANRPLSGTPPPHPLLYSIQIRLRGTS